MATESTETISLPNSTVPSTTLIKNLKHLMQLHNISEAELARQTNNPQATIHKIISGKTADPRVSTLQSISAYFKVTLDDLVEGSPSSSTDKPISKLNVQSIPIINWKSCLDSDTVISSLSTANWDNWVPAQDLSADAYGLITKTSMEPRFPKGTVILIEPQIAPIDGDLILVHYPETEEATLREFLVDGPNKYLVSINERNEQEKFDPDIKILGTMIEFRFLQDR